MSDTDGGPVPAPGSVPAPTGWSAPGSNSTPTPPAPAAPSAAPTPAPAGGYTGYGPPTVAPPPGAPHPPPGAPHPAPGGPQSTPGAPQAHWSTALTAHKPGIIALRPLGFGDILEGAFAAMRRNPRTFFGLALLTSLGIVLLLAVIGALGYLGITQAASSQMADVLLAIGTVGGLTLVYVASAITGVVLTGMLSYPVGEAVLGRKPSIGETWRRTRGMLPRLAGLCLIVFIPVVVVFGGLIALVIVAFDQQANAAGGTAIVALVLALVVMAYVGVRLALATPALVLEELGVMASLRRSWALTEGRFWRTLGVLFVSSLIVGVVQQIIAVGFQVVGGALAFALSATAGSAGTENLFLVVVFGVTFLGAMLASLMTQPFLAAVGALLYTDARIRKEGFDLALVRAATGARVAG